MKFLSHELDFHIENKIICISMQYIFLILHYYENNT